MNCPMVSIVMPLYNSEAFIRESIDSVIHQTFTNWELWIIDDCSTDRSPELIQQYKEEDSRIHYERLSVNSGAAAARTRAIQLSEGKYIAFLDADDLWHPEKLEKQIGYMSEYNIAFSATGYQQIDENGNSLNRNLIPPKRTSFNKMFYLGDPIGNLTVIYDQERLGKFVVPNIRKRNDYALWLEILKHTDYCYGMKDILASYRIHSNSLSRNKLKLIKYQWHLYRKVEKFSLLKCITGIISWGFVKVMGNLLHKK